MQAPLVPSSPLYRPPKKETRGGSPTISGSPLDPGPSFLKSPPRPPPPPPPLQPPSLHPLQPNVWQPPEPLPAMLSVSAAPPAHASQEPPSSPPTCPDAPLSGSSAFTAPCQLSHSPHPSVFPSPTPPSSPPTCPDAPLSAPSASTIPCHLSPSPHPSILPSPTPSSSLPPCDVASSLTLDISPFGLWALLCLSRSARQIRPSLICLLMTRPPPLYPTLSSLPPLRLPLFFTRAPFPRLCGVPLLESFQGLLTHHQR
ncbi:hypothetical protein AMTRI_Chr03g48130 [Amborella trichopoda]